MPAMALIQRQSIDYQKAHTEEDQTRNLGGFYVVLVVVTALCMFLRVFSRKITQLGIERDDWTFLLGSTLAEGLFIVALIYAFGAGLGKHCIFLTPDQMILFPKLNYAFNILNLACYPIIKISILLLYLRIFVINRVYMLCWGGILFLSCMCIANTLVAMFACMLVRGFFDSSVPARCINYIQFYWCTAVLNVITDIYILMLPIPVVWKLHTTFKRKIAISLIFAIGSLTFIVSLVRIVYYLDYSPAYPSYLFLGTAYATPAEVCLAIIVSSAPTWRPMWTYTSNMAHSLFSRSSGSREVLNFTAAHSRAQCIVLSEHPKHRNLGVITGELTTMLRNSSAIRVNSSAGGKDDASVQKRPTTTGRVAPSTAHSSSHSEVSPEVAPSQDV